MNNPVRLLFCTDGIFPHAIGGMQRHSRLLPEDLAKDERLSLTVVHPHGKKVFDHPRIAEIFVDPIDVSKNYLIESYKYSKRVYGVIAKEKPHLVYAQGLTVWHNIKKIECPVIVNPHGLEPYQAISFKEKLTAIPFKFIFNRIFRKADYVVSLGGDLTRILSRHVRNEKIVELANATLLVPNVHRDFHSTETKFLFVARFAHNKGIHVLMEAIQKLNAEGYAPVTSFYLAGKGPLFQHYSTYNKSPNIHYLGFVTDEQLAELYRTNDAFVFPTLFEGMPTVVLEAMSHGMPVIVSNVGATAVLVGNENGFLIEKNNVGELAKAIIKFCSLSPAEKQLMSKMSRNKVVKEFTWESVAAKHVEFFIQIIQK